MQVNFNPNMSFKSNEVSPHEQSEAAVGIKHSKPDTFEKSSVKEDIGKVAKCFTTLSEMTKASVKALMYGAVTTVVGLACGWMFGALPKGFKKSGSLKQTFGHPLKSISKKAKILTGVATVAVAGFNIIKGILNTNQHTANIDHKLRIGHRDT